jgi:hypothetical protein
VGAGEVLDVFLETADSSIEIALYLVELVTRLIEDAPGVLAGWDEPKALGGQAFCVRQEGRDAFLQKGLGMIGG